MKSFSEGKRGGIALLEEIGDVSGLDRMSGDELRGDMFLKDKLAGGSDIREELDPAEIDTLGVVGEVDIWVIIGLSATSGLHDDPGALVSIRNREIAFTGWELIAAGSWGEFNPRNIEHCVLVFGLPSTEIVVNIVEDVVGGSSGESVLLDFLDRFLEGDPFNWGLMISLRKLMADGVFVFPPVSSVVG